METLESINWLKKNELFDACEKSALILKKIFMPCLYVQDEKILILGDKGSKNKKIAPVMAGGYYIAANSLNLNSKLVLQAPKSRGDDAEDHIINSLADLQEKSIVFICMSDKLGGINELGKSFRKYCEKKKFKYVSTTSLGDLDLNKLDGVLKSIDINYKPMQDKLKLLKDILDKGKEIHITTDKGTDIYCNINSIQAIASDGNFLEFGKGGNLPAGEVYIAPNGRNVRGKVVLDGSSRTHEGTTLIKKETTLTIEDGSIVKIEGGEEAKILDRTLTWAEKRSKYPNTVRRICEIGFGLNPNASIIGASIIDEKAINTAHIGIGSNYWFGGPIYGIIHLDQVFRNPKLYVDDNLIEL